MVGLTRVELVTSSLSGTRSNQLSYKPGGFFGREAEHFFEQGKPVSCFNIGPRCADLLLRKEVIQPLVPQRLPCYDFIPITTHTLG